MQLVAHLVACVYQPNAAVLSTMNVIFKMAPGITSLGLAPSKDRGLGGIQTQMPPVYAKFMFAHPWTSFFLDCKPFWGPLADACGQHRALFDARIRHFLSFWSYSRS